MATIEGTRTCTTAGAAPAPCALRSVPDEHGRTISPRELEVVTTFGPHDDYRPVVQLVVAAAEALDPPLPGCRLEDLRLAVTEACSNAVKVHRDDAEEPVVVTCRLDEDRFCVDVHDRGPGFDPDALEPLPEPDDPRRLQHEHGLGVPLIRELADDVRFRPAADGTIVSMALERRPSTR